MARKKSPENPTKMSGASLNDATKDVVYESDLVQTNENGEVTAQSSTSVARIPSEPRFVKLYLQDVLYLSDMPQQYDALLLALMRYVSFADAKYGMSIPLVAQVKKDICAEMGWKKMQSLDNALAKLVKGKILSKIGRGFYRLNPYLFGVGEWPDIRKLRLQIEYDEIHGRTFAAVLNEAETQAKANSKAIAEAIEEEQTRLAV